MLQAVTKQRRIGGWRPRVGIAEECDMYNRLGEVRQLANIGESLYSYRQHTASSVASAPVARRQAMRLVKILAVEREMFGSDSLDAMPEDYLAAVRKGAMPTPLRACSESARVLLSVADRLRRTGEPREAMSYLVHAWRVHRLSVLPMWHVVRLLLCTRLTPERCARSATVRGQRAAGCGCWRRVAAYE